MAASWESIPDRGEAQRSRSFCPRRVNRPLRLPQTLTDTKTSTGTGTILLVEDEEALLQLTADLLGECGYTVLSARDGVAGARNCAIIRSSPSIFS